MLCLVGIFSGFWGFLLGFSRDFNGVYKRINGFRKSDFYVLFCSIFRGPLVGFWYCSYGFRDLGWVFLVRERFGSERDERE